jgi:hypothetical protein
MNNKDVREIEKCHSNFDWNFKGRLWSDTKYEEAHSLWFVGTTGK